MPSLFIVNETFSCKNCEDKRTDLARGALILNVTPPPKRWITGDSTGRLYIRETGALYPISGSITAA
jgi:hypothetical protein